MSLSVTDHSSPQMSPDALNLCISCLQQLYSQSDFAKWSAGVKIFRIWYFCTYKNYKNIHNLGKHIQLQHWNAPHSSSVVLSIERLQLTLQIFVKEWRWHEFELFLARGSRSVSHALVFTDNPATENIETLILLHGIIAIADLKTDNYLYNFFPLKLVNHNVYIRK